MSVNVKKTMETTNIRKCLTIAFIIGSAHFSTVASDAVEQKMIIDTINYCDALTVLHESSYMSKCSEIPFPTTFKENDIDLALCMMIFDTMNKICQNIIYKEYKITIPDTVKKLDDSIRKFEPKSSDYDSFIANLCKTMVSVFNNWGASDVKSDPSVDPYSKYVSGILFEQHECGYTCHKPNNTVNPLCMIFLWFNELLSNVKRPKAITLITKNVENSAVTSNNIIHKDLSTLENTKNSHISIIQQKIEKIEVRTSPLNKASTKRTENKLSTDSEKADHSKVSSVNNNEYSSKKDSEIHTMEDKQRTGPIFSMKEKVIVITYKPSENLMENPNNIYQPEEINSDKVLISKEDQQIKKINQNKDDEVDEHDGGNDLKESISNIDDEMFSSRNFGDQQGLPQDIKKSYPPLSVIKEEDESHFFTYFSIITLICIGLYIGYHNKQKILAMVLEGRRSRRGRSGSRRRPSTANYHKLDCNLEEAVTSQCNSNVTHIIY
ncbi:PREDICTED: trans-Golgi network integral membrane protein TGN38-like [Ceratosolen solmsi marchali]|uniref:Trans-Golgi network integral membrane protein TGN38-like n=1 Tax=Ceratosolen solmsi marchali TaxID=326594 RepID=A0AAJ7DVI1_9HYME|nr:PREDICTED: trans-Golgi network integral membrane protein TGN38-like [Ceratosolen solmsi marchali]